MMSVSTGSSSNRKRSPPNGDAIETQHNKRSSRGHDAAEEADSSSTTVVGSNAITLPEELYWKHIQDYIPVGDRPILNKRTGSTQFYAGDRVAIDSEFLAKYGDFIPTDPLGTPGQPNFSFSFEERNDDEDEFTTLGKLQNARDLWDEHMSKLKGSAKRLQSCLALFQKGVYRDHPAYAPLFFPDKGGVEDIIRFHVSMNPMCINEKIEEWDGWNLLGRWVVKFLNHATGDWADSAHYSATGHVKYILEKLLRCANQESVKPFFDANATRGARFSMGMYVPANSSTTVFEYLEKCSEYFWEEHEQGFGELDWVIGELLEKEETRQRIIDTRIEAETNGRPLRFAVGDRVECKLGHAQTSWRSGTVVRAGNQEIRWPMKGPVPYHIDLDSEEMGMAYAPYDSEEVIRALNE